MTKRKDMHFVPKRRRDKSSFVGLWPLGLCALLAALVPCAATESDNYTVEVCPNAIWRDAIFLRGPSSADVFDNVTHWKKQQATDYIKTTVLPQVQANIAFAVMTLVALVVFLMWRLLRRCCMTCCMRESCAQKRAAADPQTILSGWGFWFSKVAIWLFAVAALGMMLAGIALAPKELVVKVWAPVNNFTSYLNDTTVSMDQLVADLGGVNPILDNLTDIANHDVNFALLTTNLQTISTALDLSAAKPTTLTTQLTSLDTASTSVRSQLLSLRSQLSTTSGLGANLSTLSAGLPAWSAAVVTLTNYSTLLTALNGQLSALSSAPGPAYDTTALESALSAVELPTWRSTCSQLLSSLDTWRGLQAANSLATLATAANNLNTAISDLTNNKLPATSAALVAFSGAWTPITPAVKALLDRVDYIQANVLILDAASTASLQRLRTLYGNLTALTSLQPSPAALASNLTALGSELNLGSSVSTLVSGLNSLQSTLNAVPLATLDDARSAVAAVGAALDALAAQKNSTTSAISAFKANTTAATFAAMKTTATSGSGSTWTLSQTAQSASSVAASNTSVLAVQIAASSPSLTSQLAALTASMASVDSAAAACLTTLGSRVPPLGPYMAAVAGAKAVYDSLPSPQPSAELNSITSTVADLQDLVVSVPADVRSQVASVNSSFGSGVDTLRVKVVNKVDKYEADNSKKLSDVDLARYRATCVLFGVAAFFLVLLIVVVSINCPWGIGCGVFCLLVMALLLFVLAVVFAVALVAAQDGCYHVEHVVLTGLGSSSTLQPLLSYYFFGVDTTSVKEVLKEADLVDVDKVTQDVVGQANSIISNFTASYIPRNKTQAVFDAIDGFINTTLANIDVVVDEASVTQVRPLYIGVKAFACCDMSDYAAKAWAVLTFGAWLLLITANLSMAFLGRLDQLPHSGCCGCRPLLRSKLQNKVHPDGESEGESGDPEGNTKAVVLDAPGQQQMAPGAAAAAAAGGMQPTAPPYPVPPPPPEQWQQPGSMAMDPYTGAPMLMDPYMGPPYGMAPVPMMPPPYGAPGPYGMPPPPPPYGAPPPPVPYGATPPQPGQAQ